jgi:hypothetical protein
MDRHPTEAGADAPPPTAADRTGEADIPGARMAALTAYLEVHRDRFTEPALRRAALGAGYTAQEVDVAWHRLATATPTRDPAAVPFSGVTAGLTFIAVIVLGWLAVSAIDATGRTIDPGAPWGLAAWLAGGALGTMLWWLNRRTHPSFARGVGCAVLMAILLPFILIAAVFGFCLVTGFSLLGN